MKISQCIVNGKAGFKLESGIAGKRKRQYFSTRGEAETARKAALKDQADVGKAWMVLTPRERANIMSILQEIQDAGTTLEQVWLTAKNAPIGSGAVSCSLQRAVDELLEVKREANCRPRYIGNLKWYLGKFVAGRGNADVRSIGERELTKWFIARKEYPRAKRGHIALLSALFEHCWRKRYIAENPTPPLSF